MTWGHGACYDSSTTCGAGFLSNDVRAATSPDGGQTWLEGRVWNGTAADISDDVEQRPQIHADDDRVYVLVHDPTFSGGNVIGFDIVLTASSLNGSTLNTTSVLLTPSGQSTGKVNQNEGTLTALAVRGSTVCAAWEDQRDTFSIYGTCSTDRGATFLAATRWSVNGNDFEPELAFVPDRRLYLSYKDADQKDIHVRSSTNNGGAWSDARPATAVGSNYTYDYDMAVGPDNQLIIPAAIGTTSTRSESDLLAITSIDGGQTFGVVGPVETGTEEFLR